MSKLQQGVHSSRVATVSPWNRIQAKVKKMYQSTQVQMAIALIILLNFALSVIAAQVVPEEGTAMFTRLEKIDIAFTAVFTAELVFNMLGSWFHEFWSDGWNVFDFIIVSISILSFVLTDLPGLSLLRMMRVFRVIRVFKRLKSLKKVIKAVAKAIIPVLNAFGVLTIVTCIYAVIAVQLYADHPGATGVFHNFGAAIFTMFQVCTSDGWATDVVRPMFGPDDGALPVGTIAVFFVSYMLIVGTVLLNVVIAVLLDEFITSVAKDKAEERLKKDMDDVNEMHVLDPLLTSLVAFNTSKDLSDRIKAIYQVLDSDESGGLSYSEFADGVRRLRTSVPIVLSIEDYDSITEGGALCDDKGELNLESFEVMLRRQLALFVQRRVAFQMAETEDNDPAIATMLFVLKQMTLGIELTGNDNADELPDYDKASAQTRAKVVQEARARSGSITSLRRAQVAVNAAALEEQAQIRAPGQGQRSPPIAGDRATWAASWNGGKREQAGSRRNLLKRGGGPPVEQAVAALDAKVSRLDAKVDAILDILAGGRPLDPAATANANRRGSDNSVPRTSSAGYPKAELYVPHAAESSGAFDLPHAPNHHHLSGPPPPLPPRFQGRLPPDSDLSSFQGASGDPWPLPEGGGGAGQRGSTAQLREKLKQGGLLRRGSRDQELPPDHHHRHHHPELHRQELPRRGSHDSTGRAASASSVARTGTIVNKPAQALRNHIPPALHANNHNHNGARAAPPPESAAQPSPSYVPWETRRMRRASVEEKNQMNRVIEARLMETSAPAHLQPPPARGPVVSESAASNVSSVGIGADVPARQSHHMGPISHA